MAFEGTALNHSGGYSGEATPVPIPNTEVKLSCADNTWLATARKDRSPPDLYSSLAQSVEHAAVNRSVVGSSPTGGAIKGRRNGFSAYVLFACLKFRIQI